MAAPLFLLMLLAIRAVMVLLVAVALTVARNAGAR